MLYTSHGHVISSTQGDDPKPEKVARCGGIGLCEICQKESAHKMSKKTKGGKKPLFKKLDINALLDLACWNAENFSEFEEWTAKQSEILQDPEKGFEDVPPFVGWRRYSITLHCVEMTIIARKHPDNKGYQIRDYLVRDH